MKRMDLVNLMDAVLRDADINVNGFPRDVLDTLWSNIWSTGKTIEEIIDEWWRGSSVFNSETVALLDIKYKAVNGEEKLSIVFEIGKITIFYKGIILSKEVKDA